MKYIIQYLTICALAWLLIACSNGDNEAQSTSPSQAPSLSLSPNDIPSNMTLSSMMDKIAQALASASFRTPIHEQLLKSPAGASLSKELEALNKTLQQSYAYIQNKQGATCAEANPYHVPWASMEAPFKELSPTQRFEGLIKQTLALYLCQDMLRQKEPFAIQESDVGTLETLDFLLKELEKAAEAANEHQAFAEFGIQVRLVALYGAYRAMVMEQSTGGESLDSVKEAMMTQLQESLERDKGLLPQGHYEFYIAALGALREEMAGVKPLMERVFDELSSYPYELMGYDSELDSESSSRLSLAKEAFGLFRANDLYSLRAQEIAQIAQDNLNTASENPKLQNYLYGLSYLTLALVGGGVGQNAGQDKALWLSLAQEMLQKDFKDTQIRAHRFDGALLKNSCDILALSAYVLHATGQDFERFKQLVGAFKNEYSPYMRELGEDLQFYNDVYKQLSKLTAYDNTPANEQIEDNPKEEEGVDSEGYLKVPLLLSPQENEGIKALEHRGGKIDSELSESRGESADVEACFSPTEVEFMLSIAYQAYKARGFEGVAPDMMNIRLEDLFGLDMTQEMQEKLIDYGRFFVPKGSADLSESTPESLCGKHVIFDKDNGLILSEIAPEKLIVREGEKVYYRLKATDFALNLFLFYNSQEAAQTMLQALYKSEILDSLLLYFPSFREYLNTRLSPESTAELLAKPTQP